MRRREPIQETRGSNASRKASSPLQFGIAMSTVRGASPARLRHRGVNRFHPVAIDVQFLGFEVMDSRQYRQTWVKGTIGLGSVSDTKVAQDARTSGGIRFTGCNKFLKERTSRRTSLACFSRTSICKIFRQCMSISSWFLGTYSSGQRGYQAAR